MLAEIVLLGSNNTRYYYSTVGMITREIFARTHPVSLDTWFHEERLWVSTVHWKFTHEYVKTHISTCITSILQVSRFDLNFEILGSLATYVIYWRAGGPSVNDATVDAAWCTNHQVYFVTPYGQLNEKLEYSPNYVWLYSPHDHTTLTLAPNSNDVS